MDCTLPSRSSHGWRSIIAGREVIRKGFGCIIGIGDETKVWAQPWLSTDSPLCLMGPPPLLSKDMLVFELIDNNNQWDLTKIRDNLLDYETLIRRIPLGSIRMSDKQVWLQLKSGEYTTCSGYGVSVIHDIPLPHLQLNWQRHVWKVQTLPKIQSFLWKALVGALPVGILLFQRGVIDDARCKCCGNPESVMHVLRDCPFSIKVWRFSPLFGPISSNGDLFSLLSVLRNTKSIPQEGITMQSLYAWILWNLWTAKNQFYFTDKIYLEEEVVRKSILEAKAWYKAQSYRPSRITSSNEEHWIFETSSGFVCHVDAAWNVVSLKCGMGWVLTSNENSSVFTATASCADVSSALVAETRALKVALVYVIDMGCSKITVRSDSQTLIRLLNSNDSHIDVAMLLEDIRELVFSFDSISFQFIPRTLNVIAYELAKLALSCRTSCS